VTAATLPTMTSGLASIRRISSRWVARSRARPRGRTASYRPLALMSSSMPDWRRVSLAPVSTLAPSGIRSLMRARAAAASSRISTAKFRAASAAAARSRRSAGAGSVNGRAGTEVVMVPPELPCSRDDVIVSRQYDQAARRNVRSGTETLPPARRGHPPGRRPSRAQPETITPSPTRMAIPSDRHDDQGGARERVAIPAAAPRMAAAQVNGPHRILVICRRGSTRPGCAGRQPKGGSAVLRSRESPSSGEAFSPAWRPAWDWPAWDRPAWDRPASTEGKMLREHAAARDP
jgi:hypothetical protein